MQTISIEIIYGVVWGVIRIFGSSFNNDKNVERAYTYIAYINSVYIWRIYIKRINEGDLYQKVHVAYTKQPSA